MHRGNSILVRTDFFSFSAENVNFISLVPNLKPRALSAPSEGAQRLDFSLRSTSRIDKYNHKKRKKKLTTVVNDSQTTKRVKKKLSGWIIQCTPESF